MGALAHYGWALGILLVGVVVTFFVGLRTRRIGGLALGFAAPACALAFLAAVEVFVSGTVSSRPLFTVPGLGAVLIVRLDQLSALFLGIISVVCFLAILYSVRYMEIPWFAELSLAGYYPPLLLFTCATMAVVGMVDMFFFFLAWEFMTLSSYTLVIFDRKRKERLRAGFKYFLIMHIATGLMFLGALVIYSFGKSFTFDGLRVTLQAIVETHPATVHFALICFFLGFATKAGVLPFGDWLPDAYPAAPSPASSAFSGTMSKLGVYGLVRVFYEILPASSYSKTYGLVIALFGTLSIFVGTMTAMMQEDSKRLLSFHVIGQVGYMLLGVGVGVYFLPTNANLALVAISAGLFHLLNNAIYKSSLFLNAGSIFYKTETRNLNWIGGLAKLMPVSAATAVVASLSIAGIPPFNGFASKWLIYQSSVFGGMRMPLFMGFAIIAIFVSALTLASFVKFFGASFFGKLKAPKTDVERGDVPLSMQVPQLVLSGLCVFFGLAPLLPLRLIYSSLTAIRSQLGAAGFRELFSGKASSIGLSFGDGVIANWNPVWMGLALAGFALLAWGVMRAGRAPRRTVATWYCGEPHGDLETHYPAHGFYQPFKQFFRVRIGKYEWEGVYLTIKYPPIRLREDNWLTRLISLDRWLFYPVVRGFYQILEWFAGSHVGIPHVYLTWAILGVVAAIALVFSLH
ncbi:MAG: proton-conducting transporter membrane subunit [candidate division KSB1 bacterium]|nr:proton-conducting transporter membrane subunit [candidate division KSB1 bacterium]